MWQMVTRDGPRNGHDAWSSCSCIPVPLNMGWPREHRRNTVERTVYRPWLRQRKAGHFHLAP